MKTGAGEAMFTRIHEASNGLVELYVTPDNHKEAVDWARLATSEIVKELSDQSMKEVFIDPEDAYNQLALNPDWKPHTLAQRVEHLTPSGSPHQARRRTPVAITYAAANSEKPPAKKNTAEPRKSRWAASLVQPQQKQPRLPQTQRITSHGQFQATLQPLEKRNVVPRRSQNHGPRALLGSNAADAAASTRSRSRTNGIGCTAGCARKGSAILATVTCDHDMISRVGGGCRVLLLHGVTAAEAAGRPYSLYGSCCCFSLMRRGTIDLIPGNVKTVGTINYAPVYA
jgi:hypothetical protein